MSPWTGVFPCPAPIYPHITHTPALAFTLHCTALHFPPKHIYIILYKTCMDGDFLHTRAYEAGRGEDHFVQQHDFRRCAGRGSRNMNDLHICCLLTLLSRVVTLLALHSTSAFHSAFGNLGQDDDGLFGFFSFALHAVCSTDRSSIHLRFATHFFHTRCQKWLSAAACLHCISLRPRLRSTALCGLPLPCATISSSLAQSTFTPLSTTTRPH
jgi:hypothetical protein